MLASMTDEVGELVLADNYQQNRALGNARVQAASMADVHGRYMAALEAAGELDRGLEYLPPADELLARHAAGGGLSSPEFAVLLAYTKITLAETIIDSDLPDDPDVQSELVDYFPRPLRERFPEAIAHHALRREILTTSLVNTMVNRAGITFAFRIAEETGASSADILRAHAAAWAIFDQSSAWDAIARLDHQIDSDTQTHMYLEGRKLVERAARWILRNRRPLELGATVESFREPVARGALCLPELLRAGEARWLDASSANLIEAGVPSDLAHRIACLDSQFMLLDIVDTATNTTRAVEDVAALHCVVGARLGLDWLRDRVIEDLPRDDRWHALARNAMRDDAYGEHRAITTAVLAQSAPGEDADAAYERWVSARGGAVERATRVLDQLRDHGVYDFSTLSVALRELRELA